MPKVDGEKNTLANARSSQPHEASACVNVGVVHGELAGFVISAPHPWGWVGSFKVLLYS